ncbi:uncharacterized protein LOC129582988 [Paramacrobiotus metropolitanus]|uniref:uncharacterized protein LOC129582988 n=1 Tax=Paramacrobiotus metropolitanus TaxID=2943436 RepID=UPI0024460B6D|nr:uncharacterized protein LOC129582988 [Paramacrobiotus metropolitanus]
MLAIVLCAVLAVMAPAIRAAEDCPECVSKPEVCWSHAHADNEANTGYEESCAYLRCDDDGMTVTVSSPARLQHIRLEAIRPRPNAIPQQCEKATFDRATGWPAEAAVVNTVDVGNGGGHVLPNLPDPSDDYWELQHAFLYNNQPSVQRADEPGLQSTHPGGVLHVPRGSACGVGSEVICPTQYSLQAATVDVKEYLTVTGNPDIEILTHKRLTLRCRATIRQPPEGSYLPKVKTEATHTCRQTDYRIVGIQKDERFEITVSETSHTHPADSQVGWFVNSITLGKLPDDKILNNAAITPVGAEIDTVVGFNLANAPAAQPAWTPSTLAYEWSSDVVVVPGQSNVELDSTSLYCVHEPVAGTYELCDGARICT